MKTVVDILRMVSAGEMTVTEADLRIQNMIADLCDDSYNDGWCAAKEAAETTRIIRERE